MITLTRLGSCDATGMSLFRKQTATASPTTPAKQEHEASPAPASQVLFNGADVDLPAVYRSSRVSDEELDRVRRAEGLLDRLPKSTAQTVQIVDATLRAFGVDRQKIVDAATRQLAALESFIRLSHDHTQEAMTATARRIAELEAEIERCRQIGEQATHEGEDRARTVNVELVKVQRVLEFFELAGSPDLTDVAHLDESTVVNPASETKRDRKVPPSS